MSVQLKRLHVSLLACLFITLARSQAVQDPPLPLCGGNVTDDDPIDSPGYPNPYPGGEECLWTIVTGNGTRIYLTFHDFAVDGPGDVVEVYDFYNDSEVTVLGSFSGMKEPFIIISTSNKLQVNFTSTNTSSSHLHRRFHATLSTAGCGYSVEDVNTGSLSAPIYNSQHMPPKEVLACTWQITTYKNHKVALSFTDTDLGNTSSLEVKDGFGEKAPLLANYSGNLLLPDIISTQDQVFMKLTFELGLPPKLQATFIEVTAECSDRIELSASNATTTIQSPNYPMPYPNNLDCRWLIESTNELTTLVAITTSYRVADVNDVLTVHDGSSRSTPQLWSFSGRVQNKDLPWLVSSGQSLWIKFTTDEVENQGYFSMDIRVQESGGLVTSNADPYFPASAQSTVYQCAAPVGQQCVFFSTFWNCTFNDTSSMVSVYEGQRPDEDRLVRRYSVNYTGDGEATPGFSNGRMLLVVAENLQNCVGSQLRLLEADSFQHSYGQTGSRVQVPLKTLYNGWVIHPNTTAGPLLQISIAKLDLIDLEWITISQVSYGREDELMAIYKEWNGALTIYIEPISPVSIVYYDIPNAADRTVVYSIMYTMLPECKALFNTTQQGYMTTPYYPNTYPLNALCSWTINIQDKHPMHIIFEDLHILGNHFLRLHTPTADSSRVGFNKIYSGDVRPDDLIIDSSELWVNFNSTDRFTYPGRGFKFHYVAIDCGGYLTDLKGQLKSPSSLVHVTQNFTCMWSIDLPPVGGSGKPNVGQLKFSYKLLDMQTDTNWFEIRDGPNSDSTQIMEEGWSINGTNTTTVTVLSRTSRVFVSYYFRPDSPSERGFPFKMDYSTYTCSHACENGFCMHPSWRCDGIDQCGDNTDEKGCSDPVPNCRGIPVHVVATWILGVSIVAALIVGVIVTLLAMRAIRKYRSEHPGDRTLLVQDE